MVDNFLSFANIQVKSVQGKDTLLQQQNEHPFPFLKTVGKSVGISTFSTAVQHEYAKAVRRWSAFHDNLPVGNSN